MKPPGDLTQLVTHLQQTKEHFAADTDIRPVDCDRACMLVTTIQEVITQYLSTITAPPEQMHNTPYALLAVLRFGEAHTTTLSTLLRDFRSICQEHTATRNQQWRTITQQLDELTTTLAEISHHIPATEVLTERPPTDTTAYRQVSAAYARYGTIQRTTCHPASCQQNAEGAGVHWLWTGRPGDVPHRLRL